MEAWRHLGRDEGHEDGAGGVMGKKRRWSVLSPSRADWARRVREVRDQPKGLPVFYESLGLQGIMATGNHFSALFCCPEESLVSSDRSFPCCEVFQRNKYKDKINRRQHLFHCGGRCAPTMGDEGCN